MNDDTTKWILINGNPCDGFNYIGPFDNHEDAMIYGEGVGDWWVARLEAPVV